MKLDSEENRLRELFLELRREDERAVPSFHDIWVTASSRRRQTRWRRYVFRGTAAAVMLAAVAIGITRLLSPLPAKPSTPLAISERAVPANEPVSSSLPWQSTVLISQWRAPTDFLLQSSGDELLKAVQRPSPHSIDSPANAPAQKN